MQFQVSSHLEYEAKFPSTIIFSIQPQNTESQVILEESLVFDPPLEFEEIRVDDNRFLRLETGKAKTLQVDYQATVDCEFDLLPAREIDSVPIADLEHDAIPHLFPSRYCQSDRLGRLAWDLFGKIPEPYEKVIRITEWIHDNVEYVAGTTNSQTSAYDTVTQRTGVCRDFAHLGIALCRALNIPARYFTGYAYELVPQDFHACFEAYLGGRWMIFDATHLAALNGLVRIANGRDAADAAVASVFGSVSCKAMDVDCQLVPGQKFQPMTWKQLYRKGVSLE
ncbi:transglutaminase-like domain-containing protein [Planctomicrobium sp. SH661]|uniref:transglutaminase-like domain-containing protein n=1 Tax=Planctomicrobium sp. SH661 TaxID=3448124 RepID=UPI003F5C0A62